MHKSIKLDTPCEFVKVDQINPFLSKCIIKVLYISENENDPNRNNTVITKETAEDIAQSLPGSPIVGYYNNQEKDFEEHNQSFSIIGNEIRMSEDTVPYGFVDINAKVWFKKYRDDDCVERTYLCTEGWLWTGQYPEAQRIVENENGNNQSMKLHEKTLQGEWTKQNNFNRRFFIINKAIIENLCILGEKYEPCFEGGNISAFDKTKATFSLSKDFEDKVMNIFTKMKDIIEEGGTQPMDKDLIIEEELKEESLPEASFAKKDEEEKDKKEKSNNSNSDNNKEEDNSKDNSEDKPEDKKSDSKEEEDDEEDKKKKNNFSLDEIPEYINLKAENEELKNKYSLLENEVVELRAFKTETEKTQKEDMVSKFFMLSDEDETKKDILENINSYSLRDIESKLAVACFRQGLNFNISEENEEEKQQEVINTFNLGADIYHDDDEDPEWLKEVLKTEARLNGNI